MAVLKTKEFRVEDKELQLLGKKIEMKGIRVREIKSLWFLPLCYRKPSVRRRRQNAQPNP